MRKTSPARNRQSPSPAASFGRSEKRILTTRQLFQMARRRKRIIEAHLVLNGGMRATHWFTYLGKGIYLTEGIDGEEYQTTARGFNRDHAWLGTDPVWHLDTA